jgi:2'-5' RNA ligase
MVGSPSPATLWLGQPPLQQVKDKPKESARTFIALELNDPTRDALSRVQAEWKSAGAKVSWTRKQNLHVTLLFLGETPLKSLPRITRVMDAVASTRKPFEMVIKGAGYFGSSRTPRVLWAGVEEGAEEVGALFLPLRQGLLDKGVVFKPPARFRPHVTLGRVRSGSGLGALTSAIASDSNTSYGRVLVDRVLLWESQLVPQGAVYTELHTSFLEGA